MDDGYSFLWVMFGVFALLAFLGGMAFWYWKSRRDNVTEEDIKTMVDEGHEQGVLESSEAKMIRNIFELDEKEAGDVMVHRRHMVALSGGMTLKEAARFMLQEGNNTRYPVYGEDLDDIIGTIHMRDALVHAENPREAELAIAKVPGVLREAHFIPETRNLDSLFREMQSQKIHMEIVIDEYGQTAGLVTMEDILEEIVGNILDEYDVEEKFIVRQENGDLTMSGMTPLGEAQDALGIRFPEEDLNNYDTVNGLLISRLDRIPQEGERPTVCYRGMRFSVVNVENKLIHTVLVTKAPEEERSTGEGHKEERQKEDA